MGDPASPRLRWRNWSLHSSQHFREYDGSHGIPNLERQIEDSPVLFVQALALLFKRDDGGDDPPEWRIENPASAHRSRHGRLPTL